MKTKRATCYAQETPRGTPSTSRNMKPKERENERCGCGPWTGQGNPSPNRHASVTPLSWFWIAFRFLQLDSTLNVFFLNLYLTTFLTIFNQNFHFMYIQIPVTHPV